MVDIKQLQQSIENHKRPPIEKWDPPFCGDIEICIRSNGEWWYQNSEIQRPALVRLFASVLWQEGGEYFLVTPAEKVRIQVDDLPFLITNWRRDETDVIQVMTNTGEEYPLDERYPLVIDQRQPAVRIRDGFLARVHRNVYYQWAEQAVPALPSEADGFYLRSGNTRFYLGSAS